MKRFYITGMSGVGKSSVSELLNQRGIYSIDIDAVEGLCSWVNRDTHEASKWQPGIGSAWLNVHDWVCDKSKLIKLMDRNENIVVVVGSASNQTEYLNLFDKVFLLHCDEEIFIKRIKKRTNNDFGKHKSEEKKILNWFKNFEEEMLNKGAVYINTNPPLAKVVDQIVSKLR